MNGVPLVLVVIGLVEWVKQMGVAGRWLQVVSLVIGLALGLAYQYSVQPPVDFAGWFGAAIYGLGLGLVACGIFDAEDQRLSRRAKPHGDGLWAQTLLRRWSTWAQPER